MDGLDRRVGEKPVPDDARQCMNADQLITYRGLQGFGWHLKYIRQPKLESPVLILMHQDNHDVGVIEEDGTFNNAPNISIRDS